MAALRHKIFENYPTFRLDIDNIVLPCCEYVDFEGIPSLSPTRKFSILLFNIRSCRKNFLDFTCHFQEYFCKYSCIALVETWLTNDFDGLFTISGFKSCNVYRTNNGGGIRLYYRNNLAVKVIPEFSLVADTCEMLTVEVSCTDTKIILSVFYHPPTSDHNRNNMFIDYCCNNLSLIRRMGHPIVACGDFNLNLLNPLRYNYISDFVNNMLELGLNPIITIPTKYNHNNEITKYSIIDHIWTSMPSMQVGSYVIPIEITDHFPVAASFSFTDASEKAPGSIKRVFNHNNNLLFTTYVSNIFPVPINDDMNETFNSYFSRIFEAYNEAYPITSDKIKVAKNCPWMTPRIKACIRKKSQLYRMFVRGTIVREDYTTYKNRLTSLLRRAERLYYFRLFLRAGGNSGRVWSHINALLGNHSKALMEGLQVDASFISGSDMVNYANSYFVNIANDLTSTLQHTGPYVHLTRPNLNSCNFFPTDVGEVSTVIKTLKNKGNGVHDLSVASLKNNSHLFSEHVSFLYNYSIEKETFPDELKVAKVVPGHKCGPKDRIDNYRPISNLPVLSKVFEKLTLTRVTSFVNRYSLLSESQFGFRQGKNITQAAIKLTTLITDAYHKKTYAACFFLDLRKAFDTIDHSILLQKLYHSGFRGPLNQYMASYLTGRKQHIQVGNLKSDELPITKGVPQGSILGPLLFCLFINDIVDAVDVEVVLFADDAAFIISAPTLQLLYDQIHKLFADLTRYLTANKLIPNLGKSKLMFFSSRPCSVLEDIVFGSEVIEWVSEFRYLGLNLTNKMSYALHIDKVSTRISQYTGVFYNLNKILPRHILLLLYFALILPHLTLHIVIWGAAPDIYIKKLMVKQNKLLRAMLGVKVVNGRPLVPTKDMYKNLGLLTVDSLYKLHLFKFLVLVLKGSLPSFYELLLRPLLYSHSYHTRRGTFRHPLVVCEVERRAVTHQLVLLYDEIPPELYIDVSVFTAVNKYKKALFSSQ